MLFTDGQTVVHPHHGPATVTGTVERRFRDTIRAYIQLRVLRTDLELMIPEDQADTVGLRRLSSLDEIDDILAILHAPTGEEEEMWSRRTKANQEKLRIGELSHTAEVVRNLTRRQAEKGISAGEKDMLRSASKPILAEMCLTLSLTDEEAEEAIEQAIMGDDRLRAAELARLDRGAHPELSAVS